MRLISYLGALCLLTTAGCDGKGTVDASSDTGVDTTTSGTDGGTSGTDGGTSGTDGGTSGTDGGTSGTDSGTSGTDGGTSGTDSGTSGTTAEPEVAFSGLTWTLDPKVESMVHASWDQTIDAPVVVEYSFDDGIWLSTPTIDGVAGANEQLVVGIPYEMDASWRVSVAPDAGYTGESVDGDLITTGAIPAGLPLAIVDVAESDAWLESGNYLLTSINQEVGGWGAGNNFWVFIIDRQARPVWAMKTPNRHWTLFAQVSVTGESILYDEATLWSDRDDGLGSKVHRIYLDSEIEVIDVPGQHHAFVELPDGTLAWGSKALGNGSEALAVKGPGDKSESIIWDCAVDWFDVDACESNGLFYSADRDTFLYSFYTNSSLVEIDYATGETLWWAGTVRGGYEFDPPDAQFSWQHGVSYTDTGTLLLSSEYQYGPDWWDLTTVVFEYEVDAKNEALHEVWSYDAGAYASTNGDAWRLDNGDTLHLVGSAGEINEVDPDGNVLWHVDFQAKRLLGRGGFIEDLYDLVSP